MRNYNFSPPLGEYDMGTLFLVVNEVPEVCNKTYLRTNICTAQEAHKNDPFAIVFLLDERGAWYKGDYCYTDRRHKFIPVGVPAVPELIRTMRMLQP